MDKKISIIVPIYNTEKYLEKCVNSLINQTYKNLEIILVDDGAKDSSPEICDALAKTDKRIKVIHKKNGGLSSARNAGLDAATGDYIGFIDSDDYIATDMYERLIKLCGDREDIIASTRFVRVDEKDTVYKRNDPHEHGGTVTAEEYLRELLLHTGDVSVCTKLFRRSAVAEARFDTAKLNEDILFMTEIISGIKKIAFSSEVGYYYLSRSGSISNAYGKAIEDMAPNSIQVNELVQKRYPRLKKEGYRFALFQNMAYLLLVPKELRNKNNEKYRKAKSFVRHNFISKGLFNKHLTVKNKFILFLQLISTELAARIYQGKHR